MRRPRRWVAGVVITVTTLSSAPAVAAPGKCEAPFVLDPVCEAGKTVAGKVADVVTAPIRYAAGSAVDMVTSWVAEAAQWILGRVINFIDTSTTPALDSAWFSERYRFMIGLASLILLPMLLLAAIRAVVTQDLGQLLRSFFLYLPAAIFATFAAVTLTQALLAGTDSLSAAVSENIAGDVSQIFDSVGSTLGGAGPATPSFAIFFGALLLIIGSFFVWLELLIRSAAVTVAVFFLPMVLAGLVWPAAMKWTKRLVDILIALILSKFVIVAVISLATAALADPGDGGFGTVMGAAALMLMAAFSPFALLKLMPLVEGAAIEHLHGMGRRPIENLTTGGGVNQTISVMRSKVRGHNSGGLAVAGAGPGAAGPGIAVASRAAPTVGTAPKESGKPIQSATKVERLPEEASAAPDGAGAPVPSDTSKPRAAMPKPRSRNSARGRK